MFARSTKTAASRLQQLSTQLTPQSRQLASMSTELKLNTGAKIPALGFGTWQDKDAQEAAVTEALNAGYRHIDTAHMCVVPTLSVSKEIADKAASAMARKLQ